VLAGLGNGCYMSVDQALNVDVLPSAEQAGKDLGILNLSNTVGQALAPWCTTMIFDAFGGYKMVFPAAAAFLLFGTIAIMMIRKVK
jgi:MFS family permease